MSKVLSIDYGEKRIGLASGDTDFCIPFPRSVIINKGPEQLLEQLSQTITEEQIQDLVIGLPLNMQENQKENKITTKIKQLAEKLQTTHPNLNIHLVDERLTTFEAKQYRQSVKKGESLDAHAAAIILKRYFDQL